MKVLSIIGVVLALVGVIIGIYCQVEVVPNFNALNMNFDLDEFQISMWRSYGDQKFLLGSIALFLGAASVVLGLIAGIKKQKIGWIAVGIGLVSFLLGATQSTHMFS